MRTLKLLCWLPLSLLAVGFASCSSGEAVDVYTDSDGWGAPPTLPLLIEKTEFIVRAKLVDLHSVDVPVRAELKTDHVASFEPLEVLRGSIDPHQPLTVRITSRITDHSVKGAERVVFEMLPPLLEIGREYVLFLVPLQGQQPAYGPNGPVALATIRDDGRLKFEVSETYADSLEAARQVMSSSFDESLDRLRELVVALPFRPSQTPSAAEVAAMDAAARNAKIAFDLAQSDERFATADALHARLRELGFTTEGLEPGNCFKISSVLSEAKKVRSS